MEEKGQGHMTPYQVEAIVDCIERTSQKTYEIMTENFAQVYATKADVKDDIRASFADYASTLKMFMKFIGFFVLSIGGLMGLYRLLFH